MTTPQIPVSNAFTLASVATNASASTGSATAGVKGSAADTEHRFLTMLVAQLKNQDPLNPMDNAEITTQLAQISTVNGVEKLNSTMTAVSGGIDALQTVQAASLAGRRVMATGDTLLLESGSASAGFLLDQPVDRLTVNITDSAGNLVHRVDLGAHAEGIHAFQWDGITDTGAVAAPGVYQFKLQALALERQVNAQSLMIGRVDGVSRTANGVVLHLGGAGHVSMAEVKRIL